MSHDSLLLLSLALAVGRNSVGAGPQIAGEGSSVGAGLSARPPVEREDRTAQDTSLSLTEMLSGGSTEGYARATEPREFRFPEDHGAHEEFRTEWWYFTGNLTTAGGRNFGYQFTLFRNAVAPEHARTRVGLGDPAGLHGTFRGHRPSEQGLPRA